MEEEKKRHSAKPLLITLAVCAVMVAGIMYMYGMRALNVKPEARLLNQLITEKTLSCAEPVDMAKCNAATDAVRRFEMKAKEKRLAEEKGV